ncbi:unnamed protein product, partial [Effrenium voratum]
RWSCSCTESGTLRCNDGSTGDGACQCKSGFIGFSCDSCAAYMYPPGECFRRCEEGVDCFQGSCTPYTGICECEVGWEGSNCGCSVDMSPGDSCGGRGFCASDGACICDVRFDGGECAASKSYQLAEADCPYCNNNGICVEESVQDSSQFVCSCAKKLGYYGNNCEVFCSSCNPLTTRTCAVMSQVEQCYCEEWWWGQDCSRPCACIRAGSKQCLMQTGQCECKEGWAGVYCEQCAPGYYPEGACDVQCDFGTTCHLNGICGPQGTCLCNDLWDGEGCTLCTGDGLPKVEDNTSSMPPSMPPCSTRCSDATCSGHGACTDVGLCDCDPGWYGGPVACWDAALADLRGWYRSLPALPDCDFVMPLGAAFRTECHQQCTCTSPGTHFCREGRTGDGLCVCHSGWGGDNCELCAEGFFPAPSTASPSCTTFCSDWSTCGGHGTCNPFGICQCDQGWAGRNCDHCEENWYPLGACDVYCTPEETCSHHGVCSSYGLCLCEDGWTTGLRSRFRFAAQELGALPLGNSSEDELWQCLLSCSMELGVDADLDDCVELCMEGTAGQCVEFLFAVRRAEEDPVGLKVDPLYTREGVFQFLHVSRVGSVAERQNEVARRFQVPEVETQTLKKGDYILAVNGKTSLADMTRQLEQASVLCFKVSRPRSNDSGDPSADKVEMLAARAYEAKSEVEGGYLTVQRGQVLEIMRSSRTPCEENNTYQCDYIYGWRKGETHHVGGWLPVDVLIEG